MKLLTTIMGAICGIALWAGISSLMPTQTAHAQTPLVGRFIICDNITSIKQIIDINSRDKEATVGKAFSEVNKEGETPVCFFARWVYILKQSGIESHTDDDNKVHRIILIQPLGFINEYGASIRIANAPLMYTFSNTSDLGS